MDHSPQTVTLLQEEVETMMKSIALLALAVDAIKNAEPPNPTLLTEQFIMSVTGHALFIGTMCFEQTGFIPEPQSKLSQLFLANGGTIDPSKGDVMLEVEVPPKK